MTRTIQRIAAVTGICLAAVLLLLAPAASAHVTVHAEDTTAGASDVALTFRVPNERSDATVTGLDVEMPDSPALPGILAGPHPGWHMATRTVTPATPLQTDDGTIRTAVAAVSWAADDAGAGIPVGTFDDFTILVGQLPGTATTLIFKATQTYSDGQVVRWIAPTVPGQAAPEDPAPMLTLTPAGSGQAVSAAAPTSSSATADGATSVSIPAAYGWNGSRADPTARLLAAGAAALAVLLGGGALVRSRRRRDDPPPGGRDRGDRGEGPPGGAPPSEPAFRAAASNGPSPGDIEPDRQPMRAAGGGRDSIASGRTSRVSGGAARLAVLLRVSTELSTASRRVLDLAGFGALLAVTAAFLPWATTTLSDRGAALLVVHSAGTAHNFRGPAVILMGVVALIHVGLLRADPGWRTRALILSCDGLAIAAIALSGVNDGQSVNSHVSHMRVGTGEILDPVTTTSPAYGWWLTIAAGILVAIGGLGSYASLRSIAASDRRRLDELPAAGG